MTAGPPVRLVPPIPAGALARRPGPLPFPLAEAGVRLAAGREAALAHALAALGLGAGDEALVPDGRLPPLPGTGVVARPYAADGRGVPAAEELARLLGPRTRALVLEHRLGFPLDAGPWRTWCDEHGLALVEDCTGAWPAASDGRPAGAGADAVVVDLLPALGLPRTAAVLVAGPAQPGRGPRAAADGAGRAAPAPPPALARVLLPRLAGPWVAQRRRAHFAALLAELRGRVAEPYDEPHDGASPLALPLELGADPGLAGRLAEAGVDAVAREHPRRRGGQVLAVPVHQELALADLERIAAAAGGRPRPRLRLEPVEDLAAERDAWTALADASGNPFATWEWHAAWWRHFGRGRRLALAACRDAAGRVVAIVPLYAARPGLLRFLGHGAGDRQGPVCAAADRLAVARAVRGALDAGRLGGALLLGEHLPAGEGWGRLLGARVLARDASPVLRLRGRTWEQVLERAGPKLRKQTRYQERRLVREHDARFHLVEDADHLPAALDALFALHRARWPEGSPFAAAEPFHRDVAHAALRDGRLRLWLLEAEGRPVAAWHGFRFGGADWHYQSGRDPAWGRLSPGAVLQAHTIRDCAGAGLSAYHFLRGGEAYKDRFATGDPGLETVVAGTGLGRAGALAGAAAAGLPAGARRRVTGRLGG